MNNGSKVLTPNAIGGAQETGLLIQVAEHVGPQARAMIERAPEKFDAAVTYYVHSFHRLLAASHEGLDRNTKLATFAVFCLYQLCPWASDEHEAFQAWGKEAGLSADEISFAWSFVREFEHWQPGTPESYAMVITLDRAIIRGARVGASSLEPEAFLKWLKRNFQIFKQGSNFLSVTESYVAILRGDEASIGEKSSIREELQYIAREVLREVGRMYGRSGLNSVRRQIGAPPSARRPSHLAVGALFSRPVYTLSEQYLNLSVSEREAFKCILQKLDTGESIQTLKNLDDNQEGIEDISR